LFFLLLFDEEETERAMSEKQGYRNACITLHQPWASLLVHGIKRIEGRSWPAPVRGLLSFPL
jgi:hypothetical protein